MTSQTNSQEFKELEIKCSEQSLSLTEVMQHLANAEDYIRQNGEIWEKANESAEVLPEKLALIEMLKKDLETSRNQNK